MAHDERAPAPTIDEIRQRFDSRTVRGCRPLIWWGIAMLQRVRGFRWDGVNVHRLDDLDVPCLIAANHVSHADTAAIIGTLPRELRRRTAVAAALDVFGAKRSRGWRGLLNKGFQIIIAAGFHAFAFDRQGPPLRSLRTAAQLVRDHQWNLLLYPEGTRNRTDAIGEFKSGIGLLAKFTNRPVIPVHVSGGMEVLPCGRFLPGPGRMTVRYGTPLEFEPDDTPESFTRRLRQEIVRLAPHRQAIEVDDRETIPEAAPPGTVAESWSGTY